MKVVALVLALLGVVFPALAEDKLPAGVAARMGEAEVRLEEIKALLDAAAPEVRAQLQQSSADLNNLVRTVLLRKVLAAEARSKAWDKRPEVVAQMDQARDQALVNSYLLALTRPPESYPSEAEVRSAYEQNTAAFAVPRQVRLSQIFVQAPPESDKAAFAKAQAKVNDLSEKARRKGADFPALAKASSEHAESAAKGGDMGWLAEASLIAELRDAAASLKKGEVSAAVRSPQGWHLVRLDDVKEKTIRPLAEVQDQLVQALRARRTQETQQAYLTFLSNKTPLSLNESELARLVK